MTRFNILLIIGLFFGLVYLATTIVIYAPIVGYILFILVFGTLLILINSMFQFSS